MRWLRNNPVELTRDAGKMDLMSIRKGFEQISDHIGFVDAHKNYIMSHGVSSVNWAAYKKFLPEDVYAIYMQYWGAVQLEEETTPEPDLRALRPTVGVTRGVARE